MGAKILGLSLLILALLCARAQAGRNEWTQDGPPSTVNLVRVRTGAAAAWYAGGATGLYRSLDEGRSWEKLGGPVAGRNVLSLALGGEDGSHLYAGLNTGLFISADAGVSWKAAPEPGAGILSLALGAAPGGPVYAGTFGRGVFVSEDGGRTWRGGDGLLAEAIVFALATTGLDSQAVYAGTAAGLFVSRDAGRTWRRLGAQLQDLSVRAIHLSPADAGALVVGTFGGGVLRSADGGRTWAALNEGLNDLAVRDLAVDPRSEQVVYAATSQGGFFRSRDGGRQWSPINAGLPDLGARAVLVHPGDPDRILGAGPARGVWEIRFAPEARIEIGRTDIDFGAVPVGAIGRRSLEIANAGSGELNISSLRVAGRFEVGAAQLQVPPGATRSVEIRFQPQQRGVERGALEIRSNDLERGEVQLELKGTGIQAELRIAPPAVDFGAVRIGARRDTALVLSNTGNATLRLRNILVDETAFIVLPFAVAELQAGQSVRLPLRFAPMRLNGIGDTLVVLTDIAGQPRVEVPLDGLGTAPEIAVAPEELDFGSVDIRRAKTLELELANSGNAELEIARLELEGEAFRLGAVAPLVLAPGERQVLEVSFLPLDSGPQAGVLRILSNALGGGEVSVALRGRGGALALAPEKALPLGPGPADLLVVDLNGDGAPDLAVADSATGELHLLLNDGGGGFPEDARAVVPGPGAAFGAWDEPVALAAAPIFGNAPDLVVADRAARSLSILGNDGLGGFEARREDLFIGHALAAVEAVDLDADGDIDLAVADGDDPSITLLFNNNQGSFNARVVHRVGRGPSALKAANLNADGHRDLVVANRASGTVSVLLNDRRGGFLGREDFFVGLEPMALALVDYDADGDNDILTANASSRDLSLLPNDGMGRFEFRARLPTGMRPLDLALADLTADAFGDLVVGGDGAPFVGFWENDGGRRFVTREIPTTSTPVRRVGVADVDGNGAGDLVVLSEGAGRVQVFLNANTRLQDPPRPPARVRARDAARDLGGRIEVLWEAPKLDEDIGRTTEYAIFRSPRPAESFVEIGRAPAGARRFVDGAAALGDTFYYYVQAGNATAHSTPSDTVAAVSAPSPFFELELVDEPRLSLGDTLRVRAFLTPAAHSVGALSLYLSFADSALELIPDSTGAPFRPAASLEIGRVLENRLHSNSANKVNLTLTGLQIQPGVEPVALGEIWFRAGSDTATTISIDDEPGLNRRSAVVEAESGRLILPFIAARPTRVAIRDFQVGGRLELEGRRAGSSAVQVTLRFIDGENRLLQSPLNDEDRLRPGIQTTLDAAGGFHLVQIPENTYRVFAKAPTHLQGQVLSDSVRIGDSLRTVLSFRWLRSDSTATQVLPAGDGNDDNRVNLADFGLLVQHFGTTSAQKAAWGQARAVDFDGDGEVGLSDFFLLAQNFGEVGIESAPAAGQKAVRQGWVRLEEDGRVRFEALGDAAGFALFVEGEEVEFDLEETVWAGREFRILRRDEGARARLFVALSKARERAPGAGVLLRLRGGGLHLEQVEILRADGRVIHPALHQEEVLPRASALLQNYPNPFNPSTTIPFILGRDPAGGEAARVRLEIYDLLGQKVRTLIDGPLAPGRHQVRWDARDAQGRRVASGLYFYRLQSGAFRQTRRLLLLR